MRQLAAGSPAIFPNIVLVRMRGKYDCLTCVAAMLLGMNYEDVEEALGGNLDPFKDRKAETNRVHYALQNLIENRNRYALHLLNIPPIEAGRRYWVAVHIDDLTNSLSEIMSHSIVIDEAGRTFDPNPQYGEFESFSDWDAAVTLPHRLEFVTEIFEFSV